MYPEIPENPEEILGWMGQFNEARQIDLPGVREGLTKLTRGLKELLDTIGQIPSPRPEHVLPDQVARCLAWHTYSAAKAVHLVVSNAAPRMAYTCARTALEACQDLVLLATSEDYDHFGARACIATILDRDREYELLEEELTELHGKPTASVRDGIQVELEHLEEMWAKAAPEKREVFRNALVAVRHDLARGRGHWSGFRGGRRGVQSHIRSRKGWSVMFLCSEGVYKQLARLSHARPEIGIMWRGFGPYLPIEVAEASARLSAAALKKIFGLPYNDPAEQ